MFQNDVPRSGREHDNSLGLERAVSLFTCESRCRLFGDTSAAKAVLSSESVGEAGELDPGHPELNLNLNLRTMSLGASRGR